MNPDAKRRLRCLMFLVMALSWCSAATADAKPKKRKKKPRAPEEKGVRERIASGEEAKLQKGPGDGFELVGTLAADTELVVLETKGRWIRVRAGKRSGWIVARALASYEATEPMVTVPDASDVDAPVDGESSPAASQTSQSGEKPITRTWGGKAAARAFVAQTASAGTQLRSEMAPKSEEVAVLPMGSTVVVQERSPDRKWLRVRTAEGAVGWISAADLVNTTADNISSEAGSSSSTEDDASDARRWRLDELPRARVRTSIGFAYRSLTMDFSSAGRGSLANTLVETQAMAVDGESDLILRSTGRRFYTGLDAGFRFSYSKPGIEVLSSEGPIGEIDFSMYETRGGARLGVALGRDVHVALRAGLRYDVFFTKNVDNAGLLPRESLLAGTGALRIDWYRFLPDVVLSLCGEGLVVGKRKQTPGLEDGRQGDLQGAWVQASGSYRVGSQLELFGSFLYGWAQSEWTGRSARNEDVMQSSRSDTSQIMEVGLAHRF